MTHGPLSRTRKMIKNSRLDNWVWEIHLVAPVVAGIIVVLGAVFAQWWFGETAPMAVGNAIGVLLSGFMTVLALALRWYKESWEQKEQSKRVHKVVRIEIEQNIEHLDRFWNAFLTKAPKPEPDEVMANRIAVIPLPTFSHHMWESQASVLPRVLKDEELENGQCLHNHLETFTNIHSYLRTEVHLAKEDAEEWKKISTEHWKELQETYDRIYRIGNPISGD